MRRKEVIRDNSGEARAARFIKEFEQDIVQEFGLQLVVTQGLEYDDVFRVVHLYAWINDGPDRDQQKVVVTRAGSIDMGDNKDILTYLEWAIRGPSGKKEQLMARMRRAELLVDDGM